MTRASWLNVVLALAVVLLAVAPLVLLSDPEFGGADGVAQERIEADHPGYEPWFSPVWEPPSGEVASGLFALQAALGAGFLGYYFGVQRTRRRLLRDQPAAEE